jgi:excisionase family DNA binding protein
MLDKPMSVKDVADMLGMSKMWVYRLSGEGKLPHFRPTGPRGKILFFESGIKNFLRARAVNSPNDLQRLAKIQ